MQPPKPANLLKKASSVVEKIKSGVGELAGPAKGGFAKPSGPPSAVDLAAAKLEVAGHLARIKQSPAGGSREVAVVEDYLVDFIARGGTFAEFLADMRQRALAMLNQHRDAADRAANLARLLAPAHVRQRYRNEVVVPASTRSISGPQAMSTTNAIVGTNIMQDRSTAPPPGYTLFPTLSGDVSTILGLQYGGGICGLAHGMIGYADASTVSLGLQAGVSFVAAVSISPGTPMDLNGIAWSFGLGIAYGAGFDVGVSFKTGLIGPGFEAAKLITEFDGLSVGISGGVEIEFSMGVEIGRAFMLSLT